VHGIAKAGEGFSEILKDNSQIEEKVISQLKKALQPALTDLKVDWSDVDPKCNQTPFNLPPVFAGARVIVYGFFEKDPKAGNCLHFLSFAKIS
jgi:hypothetical protein